MDAAEIQASKPCRRCKQIKLLSEFSESAAYKDGHRSSCKACNKASRDAIYKIDGDRKRKKAKAWKARNLAYTRAYARQYAKKNRDKINARERRNYAEWRVENPLPPRPVKTIPEFIICRSCGKPKGFDDYHKDKSRSFGIANRCKVCANLAATVWCRTNPDWARKSRSKYYFANKHWLRAFHKAWLHSHPGYQALQSRKRRALICSAGGNHTLEDCERIRRQQKSRCACCRKKVVGIGMFDHIKSLKKGGSNAAKNIQLTCVPCNLRKNARDPIEFMQSLGLLI